MEWNRNIVLEGKIKVVTGLHIGGGNESVKIGGTDNPVAKTTWRCEEKLFEIPYIPGSSLKGKIRSLLRSYLVNTDKKKYEEAIDQMFGVAPNNNGGGKLTRLIFRDCLPTEETLKLYKKNDLTEVKAENKIDENMRATPRFIERVKPFTEFNFECILSAYKKDGQDKDDGDEFLLILKEGLKLLQQSYLGGSGTRGYGKISIEYKCETRDANFYKEIAKQ
jgi:CRISPR-associated protein Csm3